MGTAVGQYVTTASAKLRLLNAGETDTSNDTLIGVICGEVNAFIEGKTGRVLAPMPAWDSTFSGTAGQQTITIATATGLAVGDDLLLGPLSGPHEAQTVMAISPDLAQSAPAWAAGAPAAFTDVVQPTTPNGHTYECVVAGTTDATTEPTWPTDASAVVDGTAVWLDAGLTSAKVWLDAALANGYTGARCQRIYIQDGHGALDEGRALAVPRGIIMLAALEIAAYSGGPFALASQTDYFLRPSGPDMEPGWPFTEIVWTDVPTGTAYPVFYPGYANIRLIGPGPCVDALLPSAPAFGWPAVPSDVQGIAEALFLAGWRQRASSGGDSVSVGLDGTRVYERAMSYEDKRTLERYRVKSARAV